MVTSRDVARAAGVSQATVSRALTGRSRVSPEALESIHRAIDELGYVPSTSAQMMRTSRAGSIGVVASEILNPYFPRLLDALTAQAREHDLGVVLWNDADADSRLALQGFRGGSVDGVIYTAPTTHTTGIDVLAAQGAPVVVVNRSSPALHVDQVTSDHEASGYTAAEYFIAHGRRNIATIFGPRDSFASPLREKGFRRRLEESGIDVPTSQWLIGPTSYEHGWDSAMRIADSPEQPDALFCSADIIAFGALSAFTTLGVRVPEDIWVMGNDGLPMSAWPIFDLTTHRQPIEEIARRGLDRLIQRMGGESSAPVDVRLPTELIVRGSTAHA